jgi:hypothetical protein
MTDASASPRFKPGDRVVLAASISGWVQSVLEWRCPEDGAFVYRVSFARDAPEGEGISLCETVLALREAELERPDA